MHQFGPGVSGILARPMLDLQQQGCIASMRRCREIAHALVSAHADMSVLILSGSPIIGSFDFKARVDFVRIPGVIKLRNGEYTSLGLLIDIQDTLAMRALSPSETKT